MLHRYQRPASRRQALLGDVVVLIIPWRAVLAVRAWFLPQVRNSTPPRARLAARSSRLAAFAALRVWPP